MENQTNIRDDGRVPPSETRTEPAGHPSPLGAFTEGRLPRRLIQLYAGLVLYGTSMGLLVQSGLGVMPWDVFHQGVALHTPLSLGAVIIITSFVVLACWVPLRQWPGLGTISNAIVIGLVLDLFLLLMPAPSTLAVRIVYVVLGVVLNAVATGAYIGARFGPGPRDGLMTGLVRVTGRSVRLIRTALEVSVVAAGWVLGGTVGIGTLAYALAIGPLVHIFMPMLAVRTKGLAVRPKDAGAREATTPPR